MSCKVLRGEVFMAVLKDNDCLGSEQRGKRPVVIIQNDIGNRFSTTTIIACMTSEPRGECNYQVKLLDDCGLNRYSRTTVLLEQLETIDTSRLTRKMGRVSKLDMERIDKALKVSLAL